MNELKVFSNEQFGQVRTVVDNGKVWFCGKDVAEALGYSKPRNAINAHCRYALKRGIPHPQAPNKTIEMLFVPEGDLYRLITHSQLPRAEKFESWVFDEVLPEIRTTGGYESRPKANNEQLIQIANIIAKCPDKRLPYVIEILNPMLPSDFEVGKYKTGTHINNKYCSLVNIETGDAVCDEPISKATVERRILNHILRLGKPGQKAYNLSIPSEKYADFNLVFIGRNRRDINIEVRDYE